MDPNLECNGNMFSWLKDLEDETPPPYWTYQGRIALALCYTAGVTRSTITTVSRIKKNWKDFKRELLRPFGQADEAPTFREQLISIGKKQDEPVTDFAAEVLSLKGEKLSTRILQKQEQ